MEGLRRNGRGKKGANCPETGAEREKEIEERERKCKREQKSDSLTAAPNGFSGEREGVERRRRHNEGATTEAEIDLER